MLLIFIISVCHLEQQYFYQTVYSLASSGRFPSLQGVYAEMLIKPLL